MAAHQDLSRFEVAEIRALSCSGRRDRAVAIGVKLPCVWERAGDYMYCTHCGLNYASPQPGRQVTARPAPAPRPQPVRRQASGGGFWRVICVAFLVGIAVLYIHSHHVGAR